MLLPYYFHTTLFFGGPSFPRTHPVLTRVRVHYRLYTIEYSLVLGAHYINGYKLHNIYINSQIIVEKEQERERESERRLVNGGNQIDAD